MVFPGRCQNGICDTWPKFKIQIRSAEDNLNIQGVLPSPFSAQNLTTTKQVGRLKGWKVRTLPPIVVVTGIRAMITSRPSSRRPARAWGCWCWGCQYKWGKKGLIDFCWNTNLHYIYCLNWKYMSFEEMIKSICILQLSEPHVKAQTKRSLDNQKIAISLSLSLSSVMTTYK